MNEPNVVTDKPWLGLDAWGKGIIKDSWVSRPALARFLCQFEISFVIDEVYVDFYIHKPLPDVLELWSEDSFGGISLLGRFLIDDSISAKFQYIDLLFQIFKAWRNYQRPVRLIKPGILGEREWRWLERRIKLELRCKAIREFSDTHDLLQKAAEFGLGPVHEGGDSEVFICRCPAHHMHRIYLRPATGQWCCGWCPRHGENASELREFYEENQT